jgi:L-rhamnose isomerase/sugar isomerase
MLENVQESVREQQLAVAGKILKSRGVDIEEVNSKLAALEVEVPSWGFARAGTRFAVYTDRTEPQTMQDRLAAAGLCH